MSEVQKPVEETPAAAPAAEPAVTETPAAVPAAETPAEPAAASTEPAAETPAAEPAKEEAKTEVTPASEGVLGYKAPGLVKGFRFSKRFFWFSDDAVDVKQLTGYFQNEKLSVAHPTAAWASQTGKGLLFFAKRAEDKATPAGIINLADISEVSKESGNEFLFKVSGHKHTFQAASSDERASWIAALEAKAAEAKADKETITSSEGYKAELEKMTKPPVLAAVPKKSLEKAKEPAKEGEEKPEEEKKEEKVEPKEEKSRSQSRKRASIFGSFLAKKEGEKKEEKAETKEEKKEEAEAAPAAEAAAPAEAVEAPAPAAEEPKAEEKKEEESKPAATPAKSKRASIFGNFFQKQEKPEKETPAKATETPVSSTAPQLDDPVDASTSEPIKPEVVTSAPEATETAKKEEEPVTSPASSKSGFLNFIKKEIKLEDKKEAKTEAKVEDKKAEEPAAEEPTPSESTTPAAVKEKRRTSIFGSLGTKKEKKAEPAAEGEAAATEEEAKPKAASSSPLPKLGGVFRRVSKVGKKEKEPAAAPAESEPIAEGTEKPEPISKDAPAEPAAAVNGAEPAAEENKEKAADAPAATSSAPVQAAA
ncbi:hypothetical protein FQN50_003368 [Emmonsiellopsis sp. PD_5]|nr:hypothetical protein FQN50_003368 [Emmonsiellopsis sp. PD_5]